MSKPTYRFVPSPTGFLHLGGFKAAILNYILANVNDGKFIVRIEDTDQERSVEEFAFIMLEELEWMGANYDEGPNKDHKKDEFYQSERKDIYKKHLDILLEKGLAYAAYDTPEERQAQIEKERKGEVKVGSAFRQPTPEEEERYIKEGRKPYYRLKVPKDKYINFKDGSYGKTSVNTNDIGDFVIYKSDGTAMYNFACVVDDHLMGVTDVVRGFGHLSNTPKQILIYEAFGWNIPNFAHFSDILNEDGKGKLSKRKGAKPIRWYKTLGYLPEAIMNYIIVISFSIHFQNKNEEVMSIAELQKKVSESKMLKSNARFDSKKLEWMNGQHIRLLSDEEFLKRFENWLNNEIDQEALIESEYENINFNAYKDNYEIIKEALPLVKTRAFTFMDALTQLEFLFKRPDPSKIDITKSKHEKDEFDKASKKIFELLENLGTEYSHEKWEESMRALADELGWKHGDIFMALRLLIVGSPFSPPLYEAMQILGSKECLERITNYLNLNNA